MRVVLTDGGRSEAGFKGRLDAGDCVTRAIAIATERPYRQVYDELAELSWQHGARRRSARDGVTKEVTRLFLARIGWDWTPTMQIGSGCRVHLRDGELPNGRLVVQLSKHVSAVIDGVVHDNHDPSRGGTRCVYGYWAASG